MTGAVGFNMRFSQESRQCKELALIEEVDFLDKMIQKSDQ